MDLIPKLNLRLLEVVAVVYLLLPLTVPSVLVPFELVLLKLIVTSAAISAVLLLGEFDSFYSEKTIK